MLIQDNRPKTKTHTYTAGECKMGTVYEGFRKDGDPVGLYMLVRDDSTIQRKGLAVFHLVHLATGSSRDYREYIENYFVPVKGTFTITE